MPLSQGPWASVLFAPEPKLAVNGLRLEDELSLLAEHQADLRPLLGSWLTSPPAAPGRLTIYSDHGRIYAEWRLRSGQKTIDEVFDTESKSGRRFDVPGGGYYVLSRNGDLEIWDKSNLIATAERIRPEQLASPTHMAVAPKSVGTVVAPNAKGASSDPSSIHSEPKKLSVIPPAQTDTASVTGDHNRDAASSVALTATSPQSETRGSNGKRGNSAKAKPQAKTAHAKSVPKAKTLTPGEQITAKLSGAF